MSAHEITVAKSEHVALLDEHMSTGSMPAKHRLRFALQQAGKGVYLLAWQEQGPVGHVFLHFLHPLHHPSSRHYPGCAYVEALTTALKQQRKGIATSLMRSAEEYARSHGAKTIGLSVGVDNEPAQALYRKMAYQPSGIPPYDVTWDYQDEASGEVKQEGELCNFWIKELA